MNNNNYFQMDVHVPVIGWLFILWHALSLLVGIFVFLILGVVGFSVRDQVATPILFTVATLIAVLFSALGLPGIIAGVGLLGHKHWGRILAIVIAILNLLSFPVGTLVSIYALMILLQDSANEYFSPQKNVAVV